MDSCRIDGVQLLQTMVQSHGALTLAGFRQPGEQGFRYRRNIHDAVEQSAEVQSRSSDQQREGCLFDVPQRPRSPRSGGKAGVGVQKAVQSMRTAGLFLGGRLCRDEGKRPEDLTGIRIDDFAAETFGKPKRHRRFPDAGGTDETDDALFRHVPEPSLAAASSSANRESSARLGTGGGGTGSTSPCGKPYLSRRQANT